MYFDIPLLDQLSLNNKIIDKDKWEKIKMNKLTTEQLTEMKSLKSIDELEAFLIKENITLTDEEMAKASQYFESGKHELGDDELDLVAGGDGKGDEYKAQAYADGRTFPVGVYYGFCSCFIEQVWARESVLESSYSPLHSNKIQKSYAAIDVKCYACGKHVDVFRYYIVE